MRFLTTTDAALSDVIIIDDQEPELEPELPDSQTGRGVGSVS